MEFIFIIISLLIGMLVGGIIVSRFIRKSNELPDPRLAEMDKQLAVANGQLTNFREQLKIVQAEKDAALKSLAESLADASMWKEKSKGLESRISELQKEWADIQLKLRDQFSLIANEILLRNSQRLQDEHRDKLSDILNPFKEKIEKFESQVNTVHLERLKEHQSLKEQLGQLQQLNRSIGEEARNLVTALKGQSKTQGNWGELILEKILERSGLQKGREYIVQSSMTNEEGRRLQPDVVIMLPESRSIIVDSKVSLIAYERFVNAEEGSVKDVALKEHLTSIKNHIRDLGSKNYQQLYQVNTPDFVLLFIPLEPAFALAIEHNPDLFNEAFDKNIVIVTTSTLLATLRTIASIWRLENQNKNATEIARQAGDLYDKFVSLSEDLLDTARKLKDAQNSNESAMSRLTNGRGNLITRVEKLKQLGAKSVKQFNTKLTDRISDSDLIDVNIQREDTDV